MPRVSLARSVTRGPRGLGPGPSRRQAGGVPLPTLLSHALIAFERDYGDAAPDAPTLPVWSNVLRVFGTEGITDRELGQRAILSQRVVRVVLRDFRNLRWLESDPGRHRAFRLTDRGTALEGVARQRLAEVERQWRKRHGPAVIENLRNDLAIMAATLELEWPWSLTGYGPADPSLTGGSYLPAEPGPPRVPGRGTEWPVVPRDTSLPAMELPLSALLSKVLAAFTVEYEEEHLGPLGAASVFLAQVPDDAIPLARARAICDIAGTGKSAPERHLCVVVEPGQPRDGSRMVYLTPKARRIRDSCPSPGHRHRGALARTVRRRCPQPAAPGAHNARRRDAARNARLPGYQGMAAPRFAEGPRRDGACDGGRATRPPGLALGAVTLAAARLPRASHRARLCARAR